MSFAALSDGKGDWHKFHEFGPLEALPSRHVSILPA